MSAPTTLIANAIAAAIAGVPEPTSLPAIVKWRKGLFLEEGEGEGGAIIYTNVADQTLGYAFGGARLRRYTWSFAVYERLADNPANSSTLNATEPRVDLVKMVKDALSQNLTLVGTAVRVWNWDLEPQRGDWERMPFADGLELSIFRFTYDTAED